MSFLIDISNEFEDSESKETLSVKAKNIKICILMFKKMFDMQIKILLPIDM